MTNFCENKDYEEQIKENYKLVVFCLNKLHCSNNEDCEQEGIIALWKALKTYEPNKGVKFSTYAIQCIINSILTYLRKENRYINLLSDSDVEYEPDTNEKQNYSNIISELDIEFAVTDFRKYLPSKLQPIYDLLLKNTPRKDICSQLNISKQLLSKYIRQIKYHYISYNTNHQF